MYKCPDNFKAPKQKLPDVAMGSTYSAIAQRLAGFRPGITLSDHVKCFLEEHDSTLDGFTFRAVDADRLVTAMRLCQNEGQRAFAEAKMESQRNPGRMETHFPLEASFLATHGTGFREIWRGPVLSDRPLGAANSMYDDLSMSIGPDIDLPDVSSLHCAIAADLCNIHIDQMGFVIEGPGGEIIVDPDAIEHIFNELLWKTDIKGMAPSWMGPAFDRLSLIYPNSRNHYSRMGPRLDQVPLLRDAVKDLPGIGRIIGKVPLPGISFDVVRGKKYKISLNATCGIHGDCSGTVEFSGEL